MKSIDREWLDSWGESSKIARFGDLPVELAYRVPVKSRIAAVIDEGLIPGMLVLLANRLIWIEPEEHERPLSDEDRSYIFWLRERVGGDVTESIGGELFRNLLRAYGLEDDVFEGASGILFENGDSRAAAVFVLTVMVFGWDAYVVPLSSLFLCRIDHDGYIDVRSPDEEVHQQLLKRLLAFGAHVRPIDT